ncbi:MAG: transglycosylase SLT domain-containing protein [candidate division WOR-3 bacterium]|nr:transglycosylase SLT domain-containing protein [candidate division WOR-3 bacterium]
MFSLLGIFFIPISLLSPAGENRWEKEYGKLQKKALLYARTCKVRGESEVIKRAFDYSVRFWIRWDIVVRWIQAESSFIPSATSRADARGLTQLRDKTADYIGKILIYSGSVGLTEEEEKKLRGENYDLYNVEDNLLIGFAYLKFLSLFSKNPEEALARYLAGKKWLEFIDSRYVQNISDGKPIVSETVF